MATGSSYPGSLDSFADLNTGDFWTVARSNTISSAIEKVEAGPLRLNDGSAGAPAYAFRTSSTAGFFLSAANQIDISTNSTARWRVNSSGHFLAVTDNSFDIGASGATRPRDIHLARDMFVNGVLRVGNAAVTGVAANSIVLANNKLIQWVNAAGTTTANLTIGFTTSNNLAFVVPATNNNFALSWAGTAGGQFLYQNGGMGLRFDTESSADHSNPAANQVVLFTKDNGSGKTQLCAIFNSGGAQVIATEP